MFRRKKSQKQHEIWPQILGDISMPIVTSQLVDISELRCVGKMLFLNIHVFYIII